MRGLCSPGVSTNTICAVGVVRIPRIALRVVCGRLDVIATLLSRIWFSSVDFPTFGRPTMQTNPDR